MTTERGQYHPYGDSKFHSRNRELYRRWKTGEKQTALALEYGLTRGRIHAIVHQAEKRLREPRWHKLRSAISVASPA